MKIILMINDKENAKKRNDKENYDGNRIMRGDIRGSGRGG